MTIGTRVHFERGRQASKRDTGVIKEIDGDVAWVAVRGEMYGVFLSDLTVAEAFS